MQNMDRIENGTRAVRKILDAIGVCHYCQKAVPPEAKFCDIECALDYMKRSKSIREDV